MTARMTPNDVVNLLLEVELGIHMELKKLAGLRDAVQCPYMVRGKARCKLARGHDGDHKP